MYPSLSAPSAHGNVLPNRGMQKRHASGTRRAAAVRAPLHAFAGDRLFGDAAGNPAEERAGKAQSGSEADNRSDARYRRAAAIELRERRGRETGRVREFGRSHGRTW